MKDQARLFIAIALSFVVFFVWQLIFVDKEKERRQPPQPSREAPVRAGRRPGALRQRRRGRRPGRSAISPANAGVEAAGLIARNHFAAGAFSLSIR